MEKKRRQDGTDDVAIIRVEQLYPFPERALGKALRKYPPGVPLVWVQEEPINMGVWRYMQWNLGEQNLGGSSLSCVSRLESASPATGSKNSHKKEQEHLIEDALENEPRT